ncbi:MAG: MarR family winged helix-turn-helix transcriptional regulator [Pseudomonadota bacterium]
MSERAFTIDPQLQPLVFWKNGLVRSVKSGGPDFTNRQMALILHVYLSEGPHTVRGLASYLGVAKPVITRALNTLEQYGFVKRCTDAADKRSLFVQRTVKGAVFLSEFAEMLNDTSGDGGESQSAEPDSHDASIEAVGRDDAKPSHRTSSRGTKSTASARQFRRRSSRSAA